MGRPKGSKNKPKLTQRAAPEVPRSLPQRGQEEIEGTVLCNGAEEIVREKSEPSLGRCKSCSKNPAHSMVDHLCYNCHKEAAGFTFDAKRKRWVKP